MCGIAGFYTLSGRSLADGALRLSTMDRLLAHRGPDGRGEWRSSDKACGLVHRRLAIIDLTPGASQPMIAQNGCVLIFNGEIYNYPELRSELESGWTFETRSDSECILAAYDRWGEDCVHRFRGMFAFAIWDERNQSLFLARDHFGIKPLYYTVVNDIFYFASEMKALLPFQEFIQMDEVAFSEYLLVQYSLSDRTLFKGILQVEPATSVRVSRQGIRHNRYWRTSFQDEHLDEGGACERLRTLLSESVNLHLRADVPVGAYLSGGVDSSLVARLAGTSGSVSAAFHGKFSAHLGYDESHHARTVAAESGCKLHERDITADDFIQHIDKVLYHLDQPIAGPGSFPQFEVSGLAAKHVKVVMGGQGGDEIFGGYARHLAGYLHAALAQAVNGGRGLEPDLGQIAAALSQLREYHPMIDSLLAEGLGISDAERYLILSDRSRDFQGEIDLEALPMEEARLTFKERYMQVAPENGAHPFDRMTGFDFRYLLPALLHVEDRMSMAHGIESRVPFLDRPLVEFAASLSPRLKLKDGRLKHLLRKAFATHVPTSVMNRRDKMGFPVPLAEWWGCELREFVHDTFASRAAKERPFLRHERVLQSFANGGRFSRRTWALLSVELWHRRFQDRAAEWRRELLHIPENTIAPV